MIDLSVLFLNQQDLVLKDFSESDLLYKLWRFVYQQFGDGNIRAIIGEHCSAAVAIARNNDRCLENQEKRKRKIMDAKLNIFFKSGMNELGSCEIGKDCVVGDKYIDDDLVKLPKTLRDILSALVEKDQAKINKPTTIGFLMMGVEIELIRPDIPKGKSIARVTKTPRFKFPSSIKSIGLDFIPLLEIAWKRKQAMCETLNDLNSCKRKRTDLSVSVNHTALLQSFYHNI